MDFAEAAWSSEPNRSCSPGAADRLRRLKGCPEPPRSSPGILCDLQGMGWIGQSGESLPTSLAPRQPLALDPDRLDTLADPGRDHLVRGCPHQGQLLGRPSGSVVTALEMPAQAQLPAANQLFSILAPCEYRVSRRCKASYRSSKVMQVMGWELTTTFLVRQRRRLRSPSVSPAFLPMMSKP